MCRTQDSASQAMRFSASTTLISRLFHNSAFPELVLDDMAYEGWVGALGQERG
jgi:hypothetical protein